MVAVVVVRMYGGEYSIVRVQQQRGRWKHIQ